MTMRWDLVGALVDLGDLRVAHHALDREVVSRSRSRRGAGPASVVTDMATSEARHLQAEGEEGQVVDPPPRPWPGRTGPRPRR